MKRRDLFLIGGIWGLWRSPSLSFCREFVESESFFNKGWSRLYLPSSVLGKAY